MKIEYINNHATGKVGDIKEVEEAFGYYLIIAGKAKMLANKKDKTIYKNKLNVSDSDHN